MGFLHRVLGLAVLLLSLSSGHSQWEGSGAAPRRRSAPLSANKAAATRAASKTTPSAETGQSAQLGPTSATDKAPAASLSGGHFDQLDSNKDGLLDRDEFKQIENLISTKTLSKAMEGISAAGGFWEATGNSLVMIIATELGDKTFFLAAILSMRHSRSVVFIGAIGALAIMHVLSVAIGFALPALLPRIYTHYAAVGMFAYFGVRLLWEARTAESDTVDGLKEAEEELSSDGSPATTAKEDDEESGGKGVTEILRGSSGAASKPTAGKAATMTTLAVLITTFTLTFVAEWGDRSQIATIAMGAAKNPFGVMLGGVVGHALCTGLAVIGGKLLATKISERAVLLAGGALFVVFALHSLWVGP